MVVRALAAAVLIAASAGPAAAAQTPAKATGGRTAGGMAASGTALPATARLALNAGRRYWGLLPCGANVRVVVQAPRAPGVDRAADAWVTFDSALGANNLAAPAATYRRCTIAFGRSRWPTTASLRQDWDMFCLTMIHELGHLLGHQHDLVPGSVMAPVFTDRTSMPQICRSARSRR